MTLYVATAGSPTSRCAAADRGRRRLGRARAGRRPLPRGPRRARSGRPTRCASSRRSPTATPVRCCSATPVRRPTPAGSTTRATCPRLIRAGRHIARPRRYIRNYAAEIEPTELPDVRRRRGAARRRLGQAGRRLDRPRRRRPGPLLAAWTRWPAAIAGRARARRPGDRARLRRGGPARPARGRHRLHRARDRAHDDLVDEMAARGVALVPTVKQLDNFPQYAAAGEAKFPSYAEAHARAARGAGATIAAAHEAGVRDLRRDRRRRGAAARAHRRRGGRAGRRTGSPPRRAGGRLVASPRSGSAGHPGWPRATPADLVVYAADPRRDLARAAHPRYDRAPRARGRRPVSLRLSGIGRRDHRAALWQNACRPRAGADPLSRAGADSRRPTSRSPPWPRSHPPDIKETPHSWPSRSDSSAWARSARRTTASSSPTPAPSATAGSIEEIGKYHPKEDPQLHRGRLRAGAVLARRRRPADRARRRDPQGHRRLAEVQGPAGSAADAGRRARRDKTDLFNEALKDSQARALR